MFQQVFKCKSVFHFYCLRGSSSSKFPLIGTLFWFLCIVRNPSVIHYCSDSYVHWQCFKTFLFPTVFKFSAHYFSISGQRRESFMILNLFLTPFSIFSVSWALFHFSELIYYLSIFQKNVVSLLKKLKTLPFFPKPIPLSLSPTCHFPLSSSFKNHSFSVSTPLFECLSFPLFSVNCYVYGVRIKKRHNQTDQLMRHILSQKSTQPLFINNCFVFPIYFRFCYFLSGLIPEWEDDSLCSPVSMSSISLD